MSKTFRITLSGLFVFVFAFSLVVTHEQDVQAKEEYTCCSFPVDYGYGIMVNKGVWIDGECYCMVTDPSQNPNECPLLCIFGK